MKYFQGNSKYRIVGVISLIPFPVELMLDAELQNIRLQSH